MNPCYFQQTGTAQKTPTVDISCQAICRGLKTLNITITEDTLRFIACFAVFAFALSSLMAGQKGVLSYVGIHSELDVAEQRLDTLNEQQVLSATA